MDQTTADLVEMAAKQANMSPEDFLNKTVKERLEKLKETYPEKTPIEYEQVTVKVPKAVMDLLRFSESVIEQTPKEYIEWAIVEHVRAGIDARDFMPSSLDLTNKFNLNPVFQQIIGDPVKF